MLFLLILVEFCMKPLDLCKIYRSISLEWNSMRIMVTYIIYGFAILIMSMIDDIL